MPPAAVIAILLGLVVAATVIGLLLRRTEGRVRITMGVESPVDARSDGPVGPSAVSAAEIALADRATLLQFSSEVCAPCARTRVILGEIASSRDGVAHIDLDVAESPELVSRFNILQTPTTLILDGDGAVRARVAGAPRRAEVERAIDSLISA